MNNQKGLAPILIIILIAVAIIGGYLIYQKQLESVFQQTQSTPAPVFKKESSAPAEIADWKTYTNKDMSFSITYPPNWQIIIDKPNKAVLGFEDAGPSFFTQLYPNPKRLSLKNWFNENRSLLFQTGVDFTFSEITIDNHSGLKASGGFGPFVLLDAPPKESIIVVGGESLEFNQILSTFKFLQ